MSRRQVRTVYGPEQLRRTFKAMHEILDRQERDVGLVLTRDPRQSSDGFPNSSGFDRGSRGSGHADPTSSVAVRLVVEACSACGGVSSSAHGSVVQRWFGELHLVAKHLEAADSLRAGALPPEERPADLSMWCRLCLEVEIPGRGGERVHSPVCDQDKSLCRWHYEYRRAQGMNPPASLVVAHHVEGRKITRAMVEEAEREERARHRNGRRRARARR